MKYGDFKPTERPFWREPDRPTTSAMMAEVVSFSKTYHTRELNEKPAQLHATVNASSDGTHQSGSSRLTASIEAAARFVLSANLSEETGFNDLESTRLALMGHTAACIRQQQRHGFAAGQTCKCTAADGQSAQHSCRVACSTSCRLDDGSEHQHGKLSKLPSSSTSCDEPQDRLSLLGLSAWTTQYLETVQLSRGVTFLDKYYQEIHLAASREGLHKAEALCISPDIIQGMHEVLMHGSKHVGGQLRTGQAFTGLPGTSDVHVYPHPDQLPALLLGVCDRFNSALLHISANLEEAVPQLYRLAAVLFVQFVTVHPFSDGNGRLARILASHVLREATPFSVTPHADGTASTRSVFIRAITAARGADQRAFLELGPPEDFAALMVEAGWEAWQRYHQVLKDLLGNKDTGHSGHG